MNAVVVFSFLEWFSGYILALGGRYTTLQGLQFSLSLRPIVPHHHEIWSLIANRQFAKIQNLFSSRVLSPHTYGPSHASLLRVAIFTGNIEATEFFLNIGMDPNSSYAGQPTAYQSA